MSEALRAVREGMDVYDRTGEKIGTVRQVYLGSEPGAVTTDRPEGEPHSLLHDLAQALGGAELPEVMRERLLREGFIRIDTSGLFAADRYAFASQIGRVSDTAVVLDVAREALLRR